MLILTDDNSYNLRLVAFLKSQIPDANIFFIPPHSDDQPYLNSITHHGLAVETGPIPQSVLRQDIFDLTNQVVIHTLDYIDKLNNGETINLPNSVEMFRFERILKFPTNDSGLNGMIHHSLQDQDFKPLNPGSPLFILTDGTEIFFDGSETLYPVFVNEAAYYDNNIALSLASKITRTIT
jgi:aspartoacylase